MTSICNPLQFDAGRTAQFRRGNSAINISNASHDTISRRNSLASKEYDSKSNKEKFQTMYTWYDRMGYPNRDMMKKKMPIIDPTITAEDIDGLPWLSDGQRLNFVKMNKILLK